jgi:DNA end-binding protein Ku
MAARSIWKGDLSVGLVTVPVAAFVATDSGPSTSTSWLHKACHQPIAQKKTCAACHAGDIEMSDIENGVKQSDGSYVIVTKEELAALKTRSSDVIAVEAFVSADDVDSLYVDATYYLAPSKPTPGFALLREAMTEQGLVMTGKLSLYGRERRVAIRPMGTMLALQLLRTHAEVRDVTALPHQDVAAVPVDAQQLALMKQLMGMYAGSFNPTAYEDGYVKAFHAMVEAKRTGAVMPAAPVPQAAPVVDFMEALKRSLAAVVPPAAVEVPKPVPAKVKGTKKKTAAA